MALSALNAKIISLFVLLVVTLVASLLPIRFHRYVSRPKAQVLIHLLSAASGGIIFGTVFLHLIPEIDEVFGEYKEKSGKHIDYPVMEVTMGFGFMLVFLIEKGAGARRDPSKDGGCEPPNSAVNAASEPVTSTEKNGSDAKRLNSVSSTTQFMVKSGSDAEGAACDCAAGYEMLARSPGIKEYAFASALCLHALIEGIVVGFFEKPSEVFTLLIGLALHKAPIAMALVVQLFRAQVRWKVTAVIAIVFSVISPLGIGIGTAIDASGASNNESGLLAESILQSLGAGTLLYVVVLGILLEEFSSPSRHLQKCLCFFAGFLFLAVLSFIPHEHGDEHEHDGHHADEGCNLTATVAPH